MGMLEATICDGLQISFIAQVSVSSDKGHQVLISASQKTKKVKKIQSLRRYNMMLVV